MRSCSCVCTRWKDIISGDKVLERKRHNFDCFGRIKKLFSFGSGGQEKDQFDEPLFGLAISRNHILVSDGARRVVKIFDEEGIFISWFGPRGNRAGTFKYPMGISIFQDRIFVCDYNERKIYVFDQDYGPLSSITTRYDPKFICHQKQGNIIVSTDNDLILILDPIGTKITEITYASQEDDVFEVLGPVCCDSRDQILAVDGFNNRVLLFDKDGNFTRSYSLRDLPECLCLGGMCVDDEDNILVGVTGKNGVYVFNLLGDTVESIDIGGGGGVTSLLVHKDRLVVSSPDYCVLIYSN